MKMAILSFLNLPLWLGCVYAWVSSGGTSDMWWLALFALPLLGILLALASSAWEKNGNSLSVLRTASVIGNVLVFGFVLLMFWIAYPHM